MKQVTNAHQNEHYSTYSEDIHLYISHQQNVTTLREFLSVNLDKDCNDLEVGNILELCNLRVGETISILNLSGEHENYILRLPDVHYLYQVKIDNIVQTPASMTVIELASYLFPHFHYPFNNANFNASDQHFFKLCLGLLGNESFTFLSDDAIEYEIYTIN